MRKNINNSKGQMSDLVMISFFFIFVLYYILGFMAIKAFFRTQSGAFDIITRYAQHTSIKGILTKSMYEDMIYELTNIGCTHTELSLDVQENTIANSELDKINSLIDDPSVNKTNYKTFGGIYATLTGDGKTIVDLIMAFGYKDDGISNAEKDYRKEKAMSRYMMNNYTVPETIYNRTLSRGDVIYIKTNSEGVTLLGKLLSRPFFIIGTGSKPMDIRVVASVKAAITANGEYTGTEVIGNFSDFASEPLSNNIDPNYYIKDKIVLKNFKYNSDLKMEYDPIDGTPIYSSDGSNSYMVIDISSSNLYSSALSVLSKTGGNDFWINPNSTHYTKTYERLRYYEDGGTAMTNYLDAYNPLYQEINDGVARTDEAGLPVLKHIMVIEEKED